MARGLEGAFGRRVNSPWVWIPLMVAFFVGVLRSSPPAAPAAPRPAGAALLLRSRTCSSTAARSTRRCRSCIRCWPTCSSACWWRAGAELAARGPGVPFTLVPIQVPRAGPGLPDRLSRRAQPDRLERDRRRLLGRDRRGPAHARRGPVRDVPRRERLRRHVRAARLLRVRAVRAGVPMVRHAGTTCRRPTRRRSRSTSPRCWRCSSSAAGCSPGREATGSGWCSHTDGPPIRTPRSCSTRTRTTPSWRCS